MNSDAKRLVQIGEMTFNIWRTRPGLYSFSVETEGRSIHGGEPIHGRPGDKRFQEALVHYGKIALRDAAAPHLTPTT